MHLTNYRPHRNQRLSTLSVDQLFDGFFENFAAPKGQQVLNVDIYEQDDKIILDADMPGITKEDIQLNVEGKLVTLGYERKDEVEINENHLYRKEKQYGKFERTFSMPFEIEPDDVSATYENGVLKLKLSKPKQRQKKQITIS